MLVRATRSTRPRSAPCRRDRPRVPGRRRLAQRRGLGAADRGGRSEHRRLAPHGRAARRAQPLAEPGQWLSRPRRRRQPASSWSWSAPTCRRRRCATTAPPPRPSSTCRATSSASGRSRRRPTCRTPDPGPARHRVVVPPLALEPVFTGVALDGDDEPWQHWVVPLRATACRRGRRAVTFNTQQRRRQPHLDRRQGRRRLRDVPATARHRPPPRRGDVRVRRRLAGPLRRLVRRLAGLPRAAGRPVPPPLPRPDVRRGPGRARRHGARAVDVADALPHQLRRRSPANPQWTCTPTRRRRRRRSPRCSPRTVPTKPGIGTWNPLAIGSTRTASRSAHRLHRGADPRGRSTTYGARYFKFDFLVWLDCVGVAPVDMYAYREAFVAMLDRLIADHPDVTFQIDETNDYRLFPFESIARGPSWFQNGIAERQPAAAQPLVVGARGAGLHARPARPRQRRRTGDRCRPTT